MIIRFVLALLCILVLGEMGVRSQAFDGCELQTITGHEGDFLDKNVKLPSNVIIRGNPENGTIILLRGTNLSEGLEGDEEFRELQLQNRLTEIALAFLTAHHVLFKLIQPPDEFTVESITTDELGSQHVRFQQVFEGVLVWASEIIVHLDRANHVYLVQGRYIPTPVDVDTRPVLSQEEVLRIVAESIEDRGLECHTWQCELIIFVPFNDSPRLAYRVLPTTSLISGWVFIVDAQTGSILDKLSTVYTDGMKD